MPCWNSAESDPGWYGREPDTRNGRSYFSPVLIFCHIWRCNFLSGHLSMMHSQCAASVTGSTFRRGEHRKRVSGIFVLIAGQRACLSGLRNERDGNDYARNTWQSNRCWDLRSGLSRHQIVLLNWLRPHQNRANLKTLEPYISLHFISRSPERRLELAMFAELNTVTTTFSRCW